MSDGSISMEDKKLFVAAKSFQGLGNLEAAERAIANGANVNSRTRSLQKTPLHFAVRLFRPEIIQLLLKNGADPNAKDRSQRTPLHCAAGVRRLHDSSAWAAEALINGGANVNGRGSQEITPLHVAACHDNAVVIAVLTAHRADVDARDEYANTPLHKAAASSSCNAASALAENGANINVQNGHKSTPLHLAIRPAGADIVRMLIDHGADLTITDDEGFTPRQLATLHAYPWLTEILEKAEQQLSHVRQFELKRLRTRTDDALPPR